MGLFNSIKNQFSPLNKGLKAISVGDYDEAYKIAAKNYKKNDGEDSLKLVEELRKRDYSSRDLMFLEFMIPYVLGDKEDALKYCEEFLKFEPDNVFIMNCRVELLFYLNRHEDGKKYLDFILDNFENLKWDDSLLHHFGGLNISKEELYFQILSTKITLLNYGGKPKEALKLIDDLPNLEYGESAVYTLKSTSYYYMEDYDKALYYINKALEMEEDGALLCNKGDALAKLNRHKEALNYFNRALSYGDYLDNILHSKGFSLMALGEYKAAYKTFQNLTEFLDKQDYINEYGQERYDDALEQMAILEEKMKEKKFKFF